MTKRNYTTKDIIAVVKAMAEAQAPEFEMNGVNAAAIIEYCDKTVEQIDRKNEKARERNAKKKAEGDALKEAVAGVLTNEYQTREQIMAQVEGEDLTVNKIGARLTQLVNEEVAEKGKVRSGERTVMGYRLKSEAAE